MNETIKNNKTVLALGYFDGVHRGHAELVRQVCSLAESLDAVPAALTFCMGEGRLPQKGAADLLPPEQKTARLKLLGLKEVVSDTFCDIRQMTAQEYFEARILPLSPAALCFGTDYTLGSDRRGAQWLLSSAAQHDIECRVLQKLCGEDSQEISASEIKRLLAAGEMRRANALLGYCYEIDAEVIHGDNRARALGFPTANQSFAALPLFRTGVYASAAALPDGRKMPAVTNIGVRPTFYTAGKNLAETHILGFDGDLYGQRLIVQICDFLRPERRFDSPEELSRQMALDSLAAKEKIVASGLAL